MDQLLFAVYTPRDLVMYRRWAEKWRCGLELHTFTDPVVLRSDLSGMIAAHQRLLDGFKGPLGFHGAFYDMVSGSVDPDVVALTLQRYRQNLRVAAALNGQYVVFHANYMGSFKLTNYRPGWHQRQVKFWRSFVAEAADHGITILIENMWADDPTIISDILDEVDHPNLGACLDVAHAVLFSSYPVPDWIETLQRRLQCCHVNNTDGYLDSHQALDEGIIDYKPILQHLRQLSPQPCITLEMADWETITDSLHYFNLSVQSKEE